MVSALKQAFVKTNQELLKTKIDCEYSGTTAVIAVLIGEKLITAYVGDSRGLLINYDKHTEKHYFQQISRDQTLESPRELQRVINSGGRIDKFLDPNGEPWGPNRVYLQDDDAPGLAMTRSIGDKVAATVGIISEPDILEFNLSSNSKIIFLASDGIWEFLSNESVMNIILPFYNKNEPEEAIEKLINESTKMWKQEDSMVVDDITGIILFLNV